MEWCMHGVNHNKTTNLLGMCMPVCVAAPLWVCECADSILSLYTLYLDSVGNIGSNGGLLPASRVHIEVPESLWFIKIIVVLNPWVYPN